VTTREFFDLVRSHLTPGGAVALNVARFPGDRGLLDAIAATLRAELGQAWAWDALRFNTLLFALDEPVTQRTLARRVAAVPAAVDELVTPFRTRLAATGFDGDVLTDDRSPVEWLADRAIVSYIARG